MNETVKLMSDVSLWKIREHIINQRIGNWLLLFILFLLFCGSTMESRIALQRAHLVQLFLVWTCIDSFSLSNRSFYLIPSLISTSSRAVLLFHWYLPFSHIMWAGQSHSVIRQSSSNRLALPPSMPLFLISLPIIPIDRMWHVPLYLTIIEFGVGAATLLSLGLFLLVLKQYQILHPNCRYFLNIVPKLESTGSGNNNALPVDP